GDGVIQCFDCDDSDGQIGSAAEGNQCLGGGGGGAGGAAGAGGGGGGPGGGPQSGGGGGSPEGGPQSGGEGEGGGCEGADCGEHEDGCSHDLGGPVIPLNGDVYYEPQADVRFRTLGGHSSLRLSRFYSTRLARGDQGRNQKLVTGLRLSGPQLVSFGSAR